MIGLYFGRSDGLKLYFVIASPKSPNSQLHIYVANMHLVEYNIMVQFYSYFAIYFPPPPALVHVVLLSCSSFTDLL